MGRVMTKTQFGIFCAALGGAMFAVWWRLDESSRTNDARGELIFSNTPHPSQG